MHSESGGADMKRRLGLVILCALFLSAPHCAHAASFQSGAEPVQVISASFVDIEIIPEPVKAGRSATYEVVIRNKSDAFWTSKDYTLQVVILDADRNEVSRTDVVPGEYVIPPGSTELFDITFTAPKAGKYFYKVNLLVGEAITHKEPARFASDAVAFDVKKTITWADKLGVTLKPSARSRTEYVDVRGNEEGPFVTEWLNEVADLTLEGTGKLGPVDVEGMAQGRLTDDRLVDLRSASLEDAHIRFYTDNMELALGELFDETSRYTFNERYEGGRVKLSAMGLSALFVGGQVLDELNSSQFARHAMAGRFAYDLPKPLGPVTAFGVGGSGALVMDKGGSLPHQFSENLVEIDNRVAGVDGSIEFFRKLRLEGEYAGSRFNDTRDALDPTRGSAVRAEGSFRHKGFSTRGGWRRINSRFTSEVAFTPNDIEEYFTSSRMRFGKRLTLSGGFRRFNDNVDNLKSAEPDFGATRVVRVTRGGALIVPFEFLPDLSFDANYRRTRRFNDVLSGSGIIDEVSNAFEGVLRYRLGATQVSGGYEFERAEDDDTISDDKFINRVFGSFDSNFEFLRIQWTPSVSYRFNRRRESFSNKFDETQTWEPRLTVTPLDWLNISSSYRHARRIDTITSNNSERQSFTGEARFTLRKDDPYISLTLIYETEDFDHQTDTEDYLLRRTIGDVEIQY